MNSEFDNATNYRFTAQSAGYYLVLLQVSSGSIGNANSFEVRLKKNGTIIAKAQNEMAGGTDDLSVSVSRIIYLAANDYIEGYVYMVMGVDTTSWGTGDATFMSIHRLK